MTATTERTTLGSPDGAASTTVFLDFDTVFLATFQGRRGLELGLQADISEALDRLSEISDEIVLLVDPPAADGVHELETEHRLEVLREGLGPVIDKVIVVTCPHDVEAECECGRPGSGLIEIARADHGVGRRSGWHIGGDQEGVVCGRNAGLRTIRVGPIGEDHLSAVHRADYDARDLHDAANRILIEELAA